MRWIGQGEVSHYGHYVRLTTERLTSAEAQLDARGAPAVFVARIVPGLRLAIVAVCGMLRFHWWKFVAAVVLGALIYVGMCLAIGYVFGEAIVRLVGDLVTATNSPSSTSAEMRFTATGTIRSCPALP